MSVLPLRAVDPARLMGLIDEEERRFIGSHRRSQEMGEQAASSLAGGVASSWQMTKPHAIYLAEGAGSKVVDVDGNEYVDFHNGYGAVAVGHAHPKIVDALRSRVERGTHFAQPTDEAVEVAHHLRERFGLSLWRFCNSGTEATLDAVRFMRAVTGRDLLIKVEGSYHGHHDALMVSNKPPADAVGPYEAPHSVPQTRGLSADYLSLTKVVPFNDIEVVAATLERYAGKVAGMIIEPVMMNIGIVTPDAGYLTALKELLHDHGALLAFDEVKTGATIHPGGATRLFGVTPDIICLAKSIGGGLPCGAVGGTEEVMEWVVDGRVDQVGTFNGNPLTMAASLAALTEVLTPDAYEAFGKLGDVLGSGCDGVLESSGIPGYTTVLAARGSVTYRRERVRNYRDYLQVPEDLAYANWLVQINRGVFLPPWGKVENWTLSVQHSTADVERYVRNFSELATLLTVPSLG